VAKMTYNKYRLKAAAVSLFMSILFGAFVLLSGADFEYPGFPWGPVIGILCGVLLLFFANRFKRYIK
jgi:hypothetical protein